MPASKKSAAPSEVVYDGGSDGVVIHLPNGPVEFLHGVPVAVSQEDAQSLLDHPDFHPAPKATTTPKPEEG